MKRSFPHRLLSVVSAFLIVALTLSGLGHPAQAASASGSQLDWQPRVPYPTTASLQRVIYGNGQFVAESGSAILSSSDGTTWNPSTAPGSIIVYGGGQFTAVGNGVSATSTDGSTWTDISKSTGLTGTLSLSGLTYGTVAGKGLWVAVGTVFEFPHTYGTILTSPDGLAWTTALKVTNPPAPAQAVWFSDVTYTGNQFVAWGSYGGYIYAYTSADGIQWSPNQVITPPYSGWTQRIAYDTTSKLLMGLFQQNTGSVVTFISTDGGATWLPPVNSPAGFIPSSLASGAGKTVWVGSNGQFATLNQTAPTTWTWSPQATSVTTNYLNDIAYGNVNGKDTFMAVGNRGTVLTSADGTTWTKLSKDGYPGLTNIVYDGQRFVALNPGPIVGAVPGAFPGVTAATGPFFPGALAAVPQTTLVTSPDGITWNSQSLTGPNAPNGMTKLTYSSGKYFAFGSGGTIYVSSDAATWSSSSTSLSGIYSVASNGTTSVADGYINGGSGHSISSDGGQTWHTSTPPWTGTYNLSYVGGQFVAEGHDATWNGDIWVSKDGNNWTQATWSGSQPGDQFSYVVYNGQQYVAVGGSVMATSPDGVKWTAKAVNYADGSTDPSFYWYGLTYGGGQFIGVGQGQQGYQVLTSTDGLTWTSWGAPPTNSRGIVYGAGTLVAWDFYPAIYSVAAPIAPSPSAPPAPPVTITAPAAGLYTNNNLYTFKGNVLVPGSAVTVAIDGTAAGTAKLDASGTQWSFTPAAPLADGPHTVTASGNGYTTSAIPFTVKTKPPVLTATLPGGGITNQNKPTVTGTTESGATVALARDGNVVATLNPDGSGNWSYTFPTALADGSYSLSFTATDLAGNTTTITKGLKIKTSIPAVAITPPAGPASVNQPVLTGTAEAGSTVALYLGGGWAGTATADSNGAWSITLPALVDGSYWLTASATDAAGNVGSAPGVSLRVATSAQPVAITAPASGSATNQAQPAIVGTAKPGSTVNVTLDGKQAATVTAGNAGRWQYRPAAPLADGSHTVSAAATDPAGTASTTGTITFTVKTSVPAITLNLPSGNLTTPLAASGTAEVGSTVKVYVDGNLAATVQPDASGAWQASVAAADGSHTVGATALDAAGNVGKAPALTVQVVPAVTISTPDVARFTTAQPAFTGTAQPGSAVAVLLDGTPWGSVTATATGRWAYTPAIVADGSHTVSATATDSQGLTGTAPARTFTVNTTPVTLTDIAGNPAADAITALVQQGVFKGFPDGAFRPEIGVTRAQLAVIYAKALGLAPQAAAALTFSDRSQIGDWAAPYVAAMVQQGILKGYTDGSFRPNATISRAELASLLARLLQQRGIKVQGAAPVIGDQLPAWAAEAIRTAAAAGLLSPANGAFNPAAAATRGETAQAFYTLINLLQGH